MDPDYPDRRNRLAELLAQMGEALPGPLEGFSELHRAATADAELSTKVKELIALGIGVAARCDGCISFHVHDALRAGASRAEILETLGVAIMMGGEPAAMYACDAFVALEQYERKPERVGAS